MRVALVGAPGTDVCTLGRLLAARVGVQHVSIRRMIGLEVTHRTALGLELKAELDDPGKGLAPTQLVAPLLDQLWAAGKPEGFVLSGYPRDAQQWRHLRRHADVSRILHVRAGPDFLRRSLAERVVCPQCESGLYPDELQLDAGRVTIPAVLECCGSVKEPVSSARDASAFVDARLRAYERGTLPWLETLRETGLVQDVWADARWPQVFPVVEQLLGLPSLTGSAGAGSG
jgi:adenylate kinase